MTLPRRLGLEAEDVGGFLAELTNAAGVAARELGMETRAVSTARDESEVDLLLIVGSVNLYPDLARRPKMTRRVLWHIEPLPMPIRGLGDRVHRALPTGKLLDVTGAALPPLKSTAAWRRLREEAANVREPITNLAWLRRHAPEMDRIVIDTDSRADGALNAGFPFAVVPFGYHEAYAGPLADPAAARDIEVLTIANVSPVARRHRLFGAISAELGESNVRLTHVPQHTYGEARRTILERSRVVLDVHRLPGIHPLFRFVLSAAAGAAMISEPLAQPQPLVPGVHYVEAAATDLARIARDLLADEPRRRRLVEAAQELLRTELDLRQTLQRALG
ncbi:MAG: glycosyltransferase [Chloroflexota bacterium]